MNRKQKNLIAISDIHGQVSALREILRICEKRIEGGGLVLLGDYIGYTDTKQCLETLGLVRDLVQQRKAVALLGNWEDMFLQALSARDQESKKKCVQVIYKKAGRDLLHAIRRDPQLERKIISFFESLPLFYANPAGSFFFAHSGVDPSAYQSGMSLQQFGLAQRRESLVWNERFWESSATACAGLPFYVVVGHRPVQTLNAPMAMPPIGPYVLNNVVGIDFGVTQKKGSLGATFLTPHFGYVKVAGRR